MKKLLFATLSLLFIIVTFNEKVFANELVTSEKTLEVILEDAINEETELPVLLELDNTSPFSIPNQNYPGSNYEITPGDILYSSKSLFAHTAVVGHVGIVGTDNNVYHVSPAGNIAGKIDTLSAYRGRHGSNETIYVYRPLGGGYSAALWAQSKISSITNYSIVNAGKLSSIDPNYCSKFVWQAFYYGSGINLTNLLLDGNSSLLVTPSHVKNSNNVYSLTSFKGI